MSHLAGRLTRGVTAGALLVAILGGLPWALLHFTGSPVPTSVPDLRRAQAFLFEPISDAVILRGLVSLAWLLWALFVIDLALACLDLARDHAHTHGGPLRRLATALLTATVLAICARPAVATSAAAGSPVAEVPATAAVAGTDHCIVRAPQNSVHDSLWRIAERELGDGKRWPELYQRNRGAPQPDGRQLVDPDLIQPGWIIQLPPPAPGPVATPPRHPPAIPPEAPKPAAGTTTAAPATPPPQQPLPEPESAGATPPPAQPDHQPPGTPAELHLGLGVAAAVAAALTTIRLRRRRHYRPGSGRREDLAVAPAVYRLHQLAAYADRSDADQPASPAPGDEPLVLGPHPGSGVAGPQLALGVQDGREVQLNLAWARGLGLIGPGAPAAARAILLTALTRPAPPDTLTPVVVAPADDLSELLHHDAAQLTLPDSVQITADLDDALNRLEAETLTRTRVADSPARTHVMLLTRTAAHHERRLDAILDTGTRLGITAVLLGQPPQGTTTYIDATGIITATSPGPAEALCGTRMYQAGRDKTVHLLALLHDAQLPVQSVDNLAGDSNLEIAQPPATPEDASTTPTGTPADVIPGRETSAATGVEDETGSTMPLRLCILGTPRLYWRPAGDDDETEITGATQPRQRELLAFIALHRHGVTRQSLIASLWPDSPDEKPTNALNTAMSRLRNALTRATRGEVGDVIKQASGRYSLDPAMVDVDYWHFERALELRRTAGSQTQRTAANTQIIDRYHGTLADGVDAAWIDPIREAVRRDALDAVAALARASIDAEPERTLELLELARGFDPHNELVYRDIMRLQARLGRRDAIPRTLALLTAQLAEVDDVPTAATVGLASRLQHHQDRPPPRPATPARHDAARVNDAV